MAYGTIANVKERWLNISDAGSDTQLTSLLTTAAREIDILMYPHATVPLTGDDITDTIKEIGEKWTAGLFWVANPKSEIDYTRGKEIVAQAKKDLVEYIDSLHEGDTPVAVVVTDYVTEPISSSW